MCVCVCTCAHACVSWVCNMSSQPSVNDDCSNRLICQPTCCSCSYIDYLNWGSLCVIQGTRSLSFIACEYEAGHHCRPTHINDNAIFYPCHVWNRVQRRLATLPASVRQVNIVSPHAVMIMPSFIRVMCETGYSDAWLRCLWVWGRSSLSAHTQ
jgi:hypothetical protein